MEVAPTPDQGRADIALSLRGRLAAAALSGALAAAVIARFGVNAHGIIGAAFVAVLPPLAAIDIEHRVIPNRIVLPALAVILVAQIACFPSRAPEWLAATVGTALFLMLPLIVFRGGLGMGDVKLGALLGAALGKHVITALLVASFSMLPVALFILFRGGSDARKAEIPFGPFLALGGAVAILFS